MRIILIRHGRPAIETAPRTNHHGFRSYIDEYEQAGLDPASAPPEELQDLVKELAAVFTSGSARAHESAKVLAPNAELIADPLFVEAPLASPRIPLLRMRVPKWAVVARLLWHVGYHPEIEDYRRTRARASQAADILMARAARRRTGGAGRTWLFQRHDRPDIAPSRLPAHRRTPCAVLERGHLRTLIEFFGAPLRGCALSDT